LNGLGRGTRPKRLLPTLLFTDHFQRVLGSLSFHFLPTPLFVKPTLFVYPPFLFSSAFFV